MAVTAAAGRSAAGAPALTAAAKADAQPERAAKTALGKAGSAQERATEEKSIIIRMVTGGYRCL